MQTSSGTRLTQTNEKELKLAPKELSYDAQNRLSKVVVGDETDQDMIRL